MKAENDAKIIELDNQLAALRSEIDIKKANDDEERSRVERENNKLNV